MTEAEKKAYLIERFGRFYHSDYVTKCQPWIRQMTFEEYRDRQLIARGIMP